MGNNIAIQAFVFSRLAHVTIEQNLVEQSDSWGIFAQAENALLANNTVRDSNFALEVGAGRDGQRVVDNLVEGGNIGIFAVSASGILVERNVVRNSGTGISLMQVKEASVRANRFERDRIGASISTSTVVFVYDNLFSSTQENAEQLNADVRWNVPPRAGTNILGGSIVAGNAWSDHIAFDRDGDGVSENVYLPLRLQQRQIGLIGGAPPTFDLAPLAWPPAQTRS